MPKREMDPAAEEKFDPTKKGVGYVINSLADSIARYMRDTDDSQKDDEEVYAANQQAVENFARMLKYYEYGMAMKKQGKNIFHVMIPEAKKKELDKEADELVSSGKANSVIYKGNEEYVLEALTTTDEMGIDRARFPGEFVVAVEADGEIRFGSNEQIKAEEKRRAGLLTGFLEQTTSKSFTGKLKSWFVGNSKEYKNAITSLKKFADGKGKKEDAIESIKAYLDIRKSKVRDHQYGRDRFQGFMESLQTLMDPQDFKDYCVSVNEARKVMDKEYDPRHVQPEMFSPSSENSVLGDLLDEDTKARAAEAKRAAEEAKVREEEEKIREEENRKEREEQKKKQEEYDRKVEEQIKLEEEQKKNGNKTPERESKASQGPEPGMG